MTQDEVDRMKTEILNKEEYEREYYGTFTDSSNRQSSTASRSIPIPSSSPPSDVSGSGAPPHGGALPQSHGRRDRASEPMQHPAPRPRGDYAKLPVPSDGHWNVPPEAPHIWSAQVTVDRIADLAVANLRTLAQYVNEHRDRLNLSELMESLELIDAERRMITLGGISDTPVTAIGRRLDVRA